MANIYRNISIHGLTEILDDQFANLRTSSGKILVADRAMFDDRSEESWTRETPQKDLRRAAAYATFASTQEVYVCKASLHETTAYLVALMDWFEAPEVLEINVDTWTGKPGQIIRVKARDNIQVAGVTVIIRDAEEQVLERGEAVQSKAGSPWWNYTTRARIATEPFPIVEAAARDLAGNCDSFVIS